MRTKTEEKRQNIVDVAAEVFAQLGFERASMAEICARLGGSKATIYNYFPSKEALFMEVIFQASEGDFQNTMQALQTSAEGAAATLQVFGAKLLRLLYSPNVQALRRLLVAEGGRGNIGQRCWEHGPGRGNALIAAYLAQAMERGELRAADPMLATRQLMVLLEAELIDRWVFHQALPADEELPAYAARGVQAFLLLYSKQPEPVQATAPAVASTPALAPAPVQRKKKQ